MRRASLLVFTLLIAFAHTPVFAQPTPLPQDPLPLESALDAQAQTAPVILDAQATAAAIIAQAEAYAAQARSSAEDAARYAADASNFLNLFEALGLTIAIVGSALGVFGIGRLVAARDALIKTQRSVTRRLNEALAQFNAETSARTAELTALEERLTSTAAEQRQEAARANLALSLLPLGERQYRAQDLHGARQTYERALELDPKNPIIYYRLGYVAVQSGDLDDALRYLTRALEIDGNFPPAKAALGFTYRRMADKMPPGIERDMMLNKAENHMLDALRASPKLVDDDNESWWGSLGGLYRRRGQIEQAIHAYEQAAEVTPHSSYPYSNLALLYMDRQDKDKMMSTFRRVERLARAQVQAEVDNYWAYADLLTARLALGKIAEADEILHSIDEIAPMESSYPLETLKDTLQRLLAALGGETEAAHIMPYLGRIDEMIAARSALKGGQ